MFTEILFTRILELEDGWVVESVDTDFSKDQISIQIVCLSKQLEDTQTGELCNIYDHAPARKWRHLDTMQYKTYIICELPRIITSEGKVKTVQPNWASGYERHTFLFEHAVIDLLKASKNQTKTAQVMRCGFNVVNLIMHLSTQRGMARRNYTNLVFDQLSIDEKSFKKGHQYITVLSDPGSGCVLDVEEDRTKEVFKSLFNRTLTETQLSQVTTISMDMWPAYINSAEELLPNAAITHDRFHLIMYLNKAIDQVRRREVKQHEELKHTRYALLKNPENLTEKQRIKFEAMELLPLIGQYFKTLNLDTMEKRERRSFDKAFKLMVVELHKSGKSSRDISRDLDIPSEMVRRWSREFSALGDSSFSGNGKPNLSAEQQEINDLKKALKDAQIERDILKKAVGIFSKSDNKYSGS